MKHTKRLLSALLAILLVAANFVPLPASASESTEGYYTYKVIDGEATITDCDSTISGDITIPSTLGGYPVTAIGWSAFSYCDSLTSITVPDSVQSIDWYAFYKCDSLTSITIPDSVQSIGDYAFAYCDRLDSVTFGNGVKTIGDSAFSHCDSLTSITIPDSVESIGNSAFYDCASLTSVTIGNSVESIGNSAFSHCDSLTSITIPDSVQTIDYSAFYNCDSLTSITIPDSVQTIGEGAFAGCDNLTGIWVAESNATYSSDSNGVLYNKNKTELVAVPGKKAKSYEIPDSVTAIGNYAFDDCDSLTSITIPDSVESIGVGAFRDCDSLTSITIPDSVESIGVCAFLYCERLTDVYYGGTKEQWEGISIDEGNEDLLDANIHFKGATIDPLTAPEISVSGETISWAAVANADSYEVYRATSKSGKYSKVATITDLSYTDSVDSQTYYYKVKAIYTADSSKNSDYSNVVSVTFKLDAPVVSVENDANGKPKLSWSKVSGAKQYTVYVATSQNGSYKKLGTSKTTSYTDSKAKSGYTYFYKIVANASSSKYSSGYSNIVSCGVICGTPAVTVTVDTNTGKPSLSWKKVDGASQYAIYRKLPTDAEFVLLAQQTAVSYKDTTAPIDTKCEYYVQALGKTEALNGAPSKVVTAASGIAKPTVTGSLNDLGQPKLSWNAVEGAVKYEVYRSTKSGSGYVLIQTVEGLTCEDTTATIGKTYYYKVKAVGAVSKSADSSYVKLAGKCATPVISVENNDSGKPYITWEKVSGAKKYTIYVATSQNGSYKKLGTSTKTYYTDTKAKAGATYFYKVVANASSSKYNSGYSNTVSCGVICGTPAVTVTVDTTTGKPSLSWKKVDGAAKYAIYRKLPTDTEFVLQATQTAVSYKDTTAPVDTKCEYYVQALGKTEALNGAPSKVVTAASGIAKPAVTGGLNDLGQPKLSWKQVEGAVKYEVYRSTKSGSGYVLIQTVEGLTCEDTTATIGKTYYYKVKAVGAVSKSADSSYVKLAGKCAAPVISVENNDSGNPMISWAQVSGAKKYTIYRATAEAGKYTKLGTTTKLTYTDTTAKAGNTYFYKVVANASSSKYDSGYSNIVSATHRLTSSSTAKDTGSNAIWEDPTANSKDYYEETDPNRTSYLEYIATYNNTLFFYLQEDSMRMYLGKTYGMPLIASQETMLACTWFSSDSSVATVNNLGFVTPLKLGTTVISVCYTDPETGEQSVRRCDVRIESKPVYTVAQLEAAAKEEAKKIANYAMYEAGCTTDLERIAVAAALINAYVAEGKGGTYYAIENGQLVEKKIAGYNQPYGTLVTFHSTCAGDVRALGMVLEYMGFQWYHVNADKNTHQWCVVYNVDGQTAFADGAQYGVVGYGERAEDRSNWMIYRNGILQPFR